MLTPLSLVLCGETILKYMANFSMLDTFWPLIKFYQLTGCFPLEKCENQQLQPIKTWKYLLRHFVAAVVTQTATILSVIPLGFVKVLEIEANFTTSLIDLGAFLLSVVAMFALHVSLTLINVKSKEKLTRLLNTLKNNSEYSIEKKSSCITIILFCVSLFVGIVLVMIGYGLSILEKLDQTTVTQVSAYCIIFTLMLMWCGGPIITTIIIFSDICDNLISWMNEIRYILSQIIFTLLNKT